MAVLTGLLSLQSQHIKDPLSLDVFREMKNRIQSMGLAHEKLYKSKNLSRVNFSEYIRDLATQLFHAYQIDPGLVNFSVDVKDVNLNINTAIPCGLIINELISNALKYAFPGGRKGAVRVKLMPAEIERFELTVQDDGIGFPAGLDFRNTQSLGMQIVTTLTEQLDGSIDLKRKNGTTFRIVFSQAKGL